jgi:hypothetical protein
MKCLLTNVFPTMQTCKYLINKTFMPTYLP